MLDLTYCEPIVGKIRPSIKSDCIIIGENLRDQAALEMWNYDRSSPVESCLNSFTKSFVKMTIEHNNIPIAMFGIMLIPEPTLWMLTTDGLENIGRNFVRNTRSWINKMLVDYPTLVAYVDIRNKESIKWLEFIGGKMVDTVFMGIDDLPFRKYEFTCKK